MRKEQLTLENVKKDLNLIIGIETDITEERDLQYIIPIFFLAVIVGIFFRSVLIGLAVFSLSAPFIYRFVLSEKEAKKKKAALLDAVHSGDFSVSIQKLSYIAEQTVYEPHTAMGTNRYRKEATFFYFEGGTAWRLYRVRKYYDWSRDYAFSPKGLCNASLSGDEFYYIVLRKAPRVAYVYPCKYFELSPELVKKEINE